MTFRDAYLKLTGFYVLIIMAISLLFSVWVYNEATRELQMGLDAQIDRIGPDIRASIVEQFVEDRLQEARFRIVFNLFTLNVVVLAVGAGASYLLARRTMRPIEEAMEAKDRFTADASHELRTPLAAIKAEIEVALRDKKRTSAETEVLLQSNLEEIDRMSSLAEGLLVLTNETSLRRQIINADKLVKKACHRFARLAEERQIRVECETVPITFESEPAHFEKIVGILLDNAIKYSFEKATVTVSLTKENGTAQLTVTDQGRGIKASDLPYIFDRFYRADISRSKERVAGHGLGLSIAKKLANSIGAELSVRSKLGKGSAFTLKIPL